MARQYTKQEIIDALKGSNGLVYIAARQLGCTPQTIYNWRKKSKEVAEIMATERGIAVDVAEIALMKAVRSGEAWAVAFMLKTLGKDRGYVERTEHINFNVPDELIKQALDEIEAAGLDQQAVFNQLIEAAKAHRAMVSTDSHSESSEAE